MEVEVNKQGQLQAENFREKISTDQESNKARFYKDYVDSEDIHYGLTAAAVNFYEY